ncbi:MAG: hypothetical protein RLZZ292_2822 [Bacteroidota bacterium]|jgi:hypothetical protein
MRYIKKTIVKHQFTIFLLVLFLLRLLYGLTSEFWFDDELQIYLIGLKSYTTQTWPYYGPDVVYTNTQIPGALQGLLVSAGFYLWAIPESPTIVLNILSFLSLGCFAYYIAKRIPNLPKWLIWAWMMSLPWTMIYSTRVVNPSYVLVFAIPFFISVWELLPIYTNSVLSRRFAFFLLGLTPCLIMQLHLSFVLLFPFIGLVFLDEFRKKSLIKEKLIHVGLFSIGALLGLSTLIPTWLWGEKIKNVSENIVFNLDNYKNIVVILTRYLSFASYEIPYTLGGNTPARMAVINENIWMSPFALYLLILGLLLVAIFVYVFFKNKSEGAWKWIKYLTFWGYVLTFFSFFFSIKGPSSHTFYILFPLPVLYSFYCYEWLWATYKLWKNIMYAALVSCFFFYIGLGLYDFKHISLYKNRDKVKEAIEQKNYKLLGERRTDKWGYGY